MSTTRLLQHTPCLGLGVSKGHERDTMLVLEGIGVVWCVDSGYVVVDVYKKGISSHV